VLVERIEGHPLMADLGRMVLVEAVLKGILSPEEIAGVEKIEVEMRILEGMVSMVAQVAGS
jgi:hypothetical protein